MFDTGGRDRQGPFRFCGNSTPNVRNSKPSVVSRAFHRPVVARWFR
jgi:hypothetical protein